MKKSLISYNEAVKLEKSQVKDLYRKYINSSQVDLIASFGFGNELIEMAKGCYLYTKDEKKIREFR